MPRVVFFTIQSTTAWWHYVASRMEFAETTVLSDLRDEGDHSLVDDFYRFMNRQDAAGVALARFGREGCDDIILRCRSLRGIDRDLAVRMIGGMTQAIELAYDRLDPDLVVTFTIDRYVMDLLERIAHRRGVDFLEMATSIIPGQVMLMRRGRPVRLHEPSNEDVEAAVDLVCRDDFAPTYVRNLKRFSLARFWYVFGYHALRGVFFNVRRFLKRDRYNSHYLEALWWLKHRARPADVAVLGMIDHDWEKRLAELPREKRVFFGLQLFPEASMDYWLKPQAMIAHDDVVVRYCDVLGRAGYRIFVKDHPLQFGFRQRALFERLAKLPGVTLVPYDVPANVLIGKCGVSVTFTGTIGFQAAVAGLCSVVSDPYYATDQEFVHVRDVDEIDGLPERLACWQRPDDLAATRRAIMRHLVSISIEGDYFGWRDFDAENAALRTQVEPLVRSLNLHLPRFLKMRERAAAPTAVVG